GRSAGTDRAIRNERAPRQIILDRDARGQEGRFSHGYYVLPCHTTCSVAAICWSPSYGARPWTRQPVEAVAVSACMTQTSPTQDRCNRALHGNRRVRLAGRPNLCVSMI